MLAQTRKKAPRKRRSLSKPAFSRIAPSNLAILQLGVSIWNQWRANEPLTKPNLRNADVSGFHLENVHLCRADLRGANLSSAYLYEADFQEADLRKANLTRAGLIGANLHRANLAGACMQQAYLGQSDLSNANLAHSQLQQADLQSAILTQTKFKHVSLAEADLSGSFDLTASQLLLAADAHLAYFADTLSLQMGLTPANIESESLISEPATTQPEWTHIKQSREQNQNPAHANGKLTQQDTKELTGAVYTFREASRPVTVFKPTHHPSPEQTALQKLAVR